MVLFNNNFSSPITKTILSEYFTTVTNPPFLNYQIRSSGFPAGGTLLYTYSARSGATDVSTSANSMSTNPKNFQIVTEKFLTVLDKVYAKIWNESFTENAIYNSNVLVNLYSCFSDSGYTDSNFFVPAKFHAFVDRCITAGVLTEDDRLTSEDQIFIAQPQGTISTNIDTVNNIITFSSNSVININDFNTQEGSYLYGKKLYLLMTPFIANAAILNTSKVGEEPVSSVMLNGSNTVRGNAYSPWGFFKPKSSDSKFGGSVPLATHLFWRIGTPEDKEMALLEGTEVPEIIFDHLDRVSHIDTFQLKVKYGPIQFA